MALESLNLLMRGLVFQKIPSEWSNKTIKESLGKLSTQAGKKFEQNRSWTLDKQQNDSRWKFAHLDSIAS